MRPENEWFKPEELTSLYYVYLGIATLFLFLPGVWIALRMPGPVRLVALAALALVFGYVAWWIPAFYRTAAYRLTTDDIEYRRGVFFRKKSNVPYSRITNIETGQGPIQRFVGAGAVKIQTAGQSGQSATPEVTINGVADFEDIAEQVQDKVLHRKPEAVEAADYEEADGAVVAELRKIRELLAGQD